MLVWDWYSDNRNIDALVCFEGEGEEVEGLVPLEEEEEGCSRGQLSQQEAEPRILCWSQAVRLQDFL